MLKKLDLKKITAVCIDGRDLTNSDINHYNLVFNHMKRSADFYRILWVGKKNLNIENVDYYHVDGMSIGDYSNFCIKKLNILVESEFCLVFQSDGFIINPDIWRDSFYDYDYIGAPWPLYLGWPKEGSQVGNGGFSLRSKKFLEVASQMPESTHNEDAYIVITRKDDLSKNNIKIAPLEVAKDFSVENPLDDNHNIETSFGFHSKSLLPEVLSRKIKNENV